MKITMLSNSKGGVISFTTNLVNGLVRQRCKVKVFFLTRSEQTNLLATSENRHLSYLTTLGFVPSLRALVDFFFYDRPDIIHINFATFGLLAIFKKLVFKVPFILTLHGLPQPWLEPSLEGKIKYTLETLLLPFVASHASVIVTVSNYVKETLKIQYGLDSEVIHEGIEANRFMSVEKKRSKKQLGYDKKNLVILFVGRLHPYKDPLTLIKAFKEAIETNNDLRLIMVGTGELNKEVIHAIERLNLTSYVKLFRHVSEEELRLCYNASDIFVLPSINEAFGMVLLEAMASGLAIIASNSGACPEVVKNAGILFAQGNHLDLAEKIIEIAYNERLLERLGKNGRSRANIFSWEEATSKYWNLYQRVKCCALGNLKHVSKSARVGIL